MLTVNMEGAKINQWQGVRTGSDALVVRVTHDLSEPPRVVQMCPNPTPLLFFLSVCLFILFL